MPLQKVLATKDNDGHWYVIPVDKAQRFSDMLAEAEKNDDHNDFIEAFSYYMTGGDLNLVQLWAEIE